MFEWKELFYPHILQRGEEIDASKISNIKIDKDGLHAVVIGTNKYNVFISKDFSKMTCSCPFAVQDETPCKHLAAVLLFCSEKYKDFFEASDISFLGLKAKQIKRYKEGPKGR